MKVICQFLNDIFIAQIRCKLLKTGETVQNILLSQFFAFLFTESCLFFAFLLNALLNTLLNVLLNALLNALLNGGC